MCIRFFFGEFQLPMLLDVFIISFMKLLQKFIMTVQAIQQEELVIFLLTVWGAEPIAFA